MARSTLVVTLTDLQQRVPIRAIAHLTTRAEERCGVQGTQGVHRERGEDSLKTVHVFAAACKEKDCEHRPGT
jgi:hypothetical protein